MSPLRHSVVSVDVLLRVAAVVAILQSVELLYLCTSDTHTLPNVLWILGFAAQFVDAAVVVFLAQRRWRSGEALLPSTASLRRPALVRFLAATLCVFFVGVLIASLVTYQLPSGLGAGQPAMRDGHYFLNIHGVYRAISFYQYRLALRAEQQSFVSASLVFFLVSVGAVGLVQQRASRRAFTVTKGRVTP